MTVWKGGANVSLQSVVPVKLPKELSAQFFILMGPMVAVFLALKQMG